MKSDLSKDHSWLTMDDSCYCNPNEELKVCMNVVVLNLADISTASQSYCMHLELWVAWPLKKEEVKRYVADPNSWVPDIHPEPTPWTIEIITNEKMKFMSGRTTQVFIWRGKIVACECTLVTARFLESLELVNFPFDCQHLNFMIGLRCDCDLPMKVNVEQDTIEYKSLDSIGGFYNFDGRAMAPMKLHEDACTFNVRGQLLSLQDFQLWGIECEIENKPDDIPFLHCSIRISRNYQPYISRIFLPLFLIMLNSTLVFRFSPNILDAKLSYVVTNMLTIVAFLFIIQYSLPTIAYLTLVDKYTNFAFTYIGAISITCVCLNHSNMEGTIVEDVIFLFMVGGLILSQIVFVFIFKSYRDLEFQKTTVDRHTIEQMEKERLGDAFEEHQEFLVHTAIHPITGNHNVHEGSLRKCIEPREAAGWLFEGKGYLKSSPKFDKFNPKFLKKHPNSIIQLDSNPLNGSYSV